MSHYYVPPPWELPRQELVSQLLRAAEVVRRRRALAMPGHDSTELLPCWRCGLAQGPGDLCPGCGAATLPF